MAAYQDVSYASDQGSLKIYLALGAVAEGRFALRASPFAMPETTVPAVVSSADADLITFLKAIPDGRYRHGVRYPQWYLLLVAVLGILSVCFSSRVLEGFAEQHREVLNQALGLNVKRWPSDATFLYMYRLAEA